MEHSKSTQLSGSLDARATAGADFERDLVASRTRLFRSALLLLGSREEAEDATQRTLLRAYEGRARFRGESGVYTWLYRILLNLVKDTYKSRERSGRWLGDVSGSQLESVPVASPGAEESLLQLEREERVRAALARLDGPAREILILRHYQDMSYDEMAKVLGCPLGTVRSRLSAARERLRRLLVGTGTGR